MKKTLLISLILLTQLLTACNGNQIIETHIDENSIEQINFEELGYEPCETSFSDNLLWVTKTESNYAQRSIYYGCIDKNINFVIPFTTQYAEVQPFSDGRAWVKPADELANTGIGNWKVIDTQGTVICEFEEIRDGCHTAFSEGYCLVELDHIGDTRTAVLKKDGTLIELNKEEVPSFSPFNAYERHLFKDGMALCISKHNDEMYYIKTDGSVFVLKDLGVSRVSDFYNLNITGAGDFENGIAPITFTGADGLMYHVNINKNGNMVEEPRLSSIYNLK